jgi:hypothetical protein
MLKISFLNLLTVIFIVLKLTDLIAWSWFWVLFPTILNVGIVVIFFIFFIIFASIFGVTVKTKNGERKYKSLLR